MHRGKRIKIPRLEQVFDELPNVRMNIEIKQKSPSLVPDLCKLIRKKQMEDQVLIASGWHSVLREVRRAFALALLARRSVLHFRIEPVDQT